MLSMTTDYFTSKGCPESYLRRIADAGFTHVHWCHQWNTDFLYAPCEIEQIERWLEECGLKLLDLHGSRGEEKNWGSPLEYERVAGVELVQNRIDMTARLGGGVVIMHRPPEPEDEPGKVRVRDQFRRSLDELEPFAKARDVRIAIENGARDDLSGIRELFSAYGKDFLGLCYDSGHGNVGGKGIEHLASVKDRLISVHLHDNNGENDEHKPIFSATVDWPRLARIMAESSYDKCVSMESSMRNAGTEDEKVFLDLSFETGTRFARMIADARRETSGH